MRIKKLYGLHLTATNKAQIKQGLENGWTEFHGRGIDYRILSREGNIVVLEIETKDRNDYGKIFSRTHKYTIELKD